jgi:hypothetical protein
MATSSPDPDDLARAKTYPAISGYLQKPVTQAMLEIIFRDMGKCPLYPDSGLISSI